MDKKQIQKMILDQKALPVFMALGIFIVIFMLFMVASKLNRHHSKD